MFQHNPLLTPLSYLLLVDWTLRPWQVCALMGSVLSIMLVFLVNDVSGKVAVVLDSAMLTHETLNYHPLVNTMTTSISRSGLVKFLGSCRHAPRIETVSEAVASLP